MKSLLIAFALIQGWSLAFGQQQPFFLPRNEYVPDSGGKGRGPCPALNTLANHGFIPRNGTNVPIRDLAQALERVFGIDNAAVLDFLGLMLARGFPTTNDEQGDIRFNLFDLHAHFPFPPTPGSLFRSDHGLSFNESVFKKLEDKSKDGVLQFEDLLQQRKESIISGLEKSFTPPSLLKTQVTAFGLAQAASMGGHPTFQEVAVANLRSFFDENRIPDDFVPRLELGLPPTNETYVYGPRLLQAGVEIDAAWEVFQSRSDSDGVSILVLSLAIVASLILLVGSLTYVERQFKLISSFWTKLNTKNEIPRDDEHVVYELPEHTQSCSPKNLVWENLSLVVNRSGWRSTQETQVISQVSGRASPGQLTCILGPSGSGKSTLLNLLGGAHKFNKAKSVTMEGIIKINDIDVTPQDLLISEDHRVGYVTQVDSFVAAATPREVLRFSARLRLGKEVTEEEINNLTSQVLSDLRLTKVQDCCISTNNGLSGGEKRRLSLGLELVRQPEILLLDEVTSGLDSHSAFIVVQVCKEIAVRRKTTMLMVTHQPNTSVFAMMDRVILMNGGKCMYQGPSDQMMSYFSVRGFEKPQESSISDWALQVAHAEDIVALSSHGFFEQQRPSLGRRYSSLVRTRSSALLHTPKVHNKVTVLTEVTELSRRHLIAVKRNPMFWLARAFGLFLISIFVGIIYNGLGRDFTEDPARFPSLFGVVFQVIFSVILLMIVAMVDSIEARPRFCREFSTGHYRLISYALVTRLFDLIVAFLAAFIYVTTLYWMIGLNGRYWYWLLVVYAFALVSTVTGQLLTAIPNYAPHATSLTPMVVTPMLFLSGFIVTYDDIPPWIRWVVWLQSVVYAFRLALHEEFKKCSIFSKEERYRLNCLDALEKAVDMIEYEGIDSIYGDNSVLNLMQAGEYKGTAAIVEYLAFFSDQQTPLSLIWNWCKISGTDVFVVNDAKEGFCDVTIGSVHRGRVNEQFQALEPADTEEAWFEHLFGRRIHLTFPASLSSVTVEKESLFLPPMFSETLYNSKVNPQALTTASCLVQQEHCHTVFADNGYSDIFDCVEQLQTLPVMTTNELDGLKTVDGNSTGCRHLHASLAVLDNETHCPHVSYTPREDKDGNLKCSFSGNFSQNDFFSKDDFAVFKRSAQLGGLDIDTYFRQVLKENTGTCAEAAAFDVEAIDAARVAPSNFACHTALELQYATGEDNSLALYWMALFTIWLVFQICSLCLLRRKAFKL